MSTSPSWFDQEKFSRLVKKVGPKAGAPAASAARTVISRPPEKETRRLQRSITGDLPVPTLPEAVTPTPAAAVPPAPFPEAAELPPSAEATAEPIRALPEDFAALAASFPDSSFPAEIPPPEPRSVSPLARRTTSLPNLKPLFEYEKAAEKPAAPVPPHPVTAPFDEPVAETKPPGSDSIVSASPTAGEPPEFPGVSDEALNYSKDWKAFADESPSGADEDEGPDELKALLNERDELTAKVAELSKAGEERDEARRETETLRAKLSEAEAVTKEAPAGGAKVDEVMRALAERDGARRDYAKLREQFETLKLEQSRASGNPRESRRLFNPVTASTENVTAGQIDEVNALKTQVAALETTIKALSSDAAPLRDQAVKARDEASIAQRGLALSQRALQETREALREASEALAQAKGSARS